MAPKQKPFRSRQDYATPLKFIIAVKFLLNIYDFCVDLAADTKNSIAYRYYTKEDSALECFWPKSGGWCWCNPPYSNITPWVAKAVEESQKGAKVAMLVPASVGSNWWARYVHEKCNVLLLNGRLSFDGIAPYPKDCALLLYGGEAVGFDKGYDVWNWRKSLTKESD